MEWSVFSEMEPCTTGRESSRYKAHATQGVAFLARQEHLSLHQHELTARLDESAG